MSAPITQLVAAAGVSAQVSVYADATTADYDPIDSASFDPGSATTTAIRVVPSKLTTEMLAQGFAGHFLAGIDAPAGIVPGQSVLTYDGVAYTIQKKRKRVYVGVHDGWSLECSI